MLIVLQCKSQFNTDSILQRMMEHRERGLFRKRHRFREPQPIFRRNTDANDKRITDDGLIGFNEPTLLVACFFALVFPCTLCSCTSVSGIIIRFNYLGKYTDHIFFNLPYRYLYKSIKHIRVYVYIVAIIMKHFTR